jgi:hypothetical protein
LPIYEGTNGIQAIDLAGRKLGLQNGEAFRRLMAEIVRTANQLESAGIVKPAVAQGLSSAHTAVGRAAEWMSATMKKEPNRALAGATPLLRAMGLLTGAHFLCRGALAAAKKLEAGDGQDQFYKARLQSAEFFVANLLPQALACASATMNGGDAIIGTTPDEIGA